MTEPAYMDINAVLKQLPHRYPFCWWIGCWNARPAKPSVP